MSTIIIYSSQNGHISPKYYIIFATTPPHIRIPEGKLPDSD